MRVLMLGNSNDSLDWFTGRKRHEIVRDQLAAEFGEPVTVVPKSLWPNQEMPAVLERWIAAEQPDVVYINVVSFWFAYESVPLKAQRLLGKFGPAAGKAGFRLADSKRFAHNAVFRRIRRFAQATIGGDTHFTPDEVIECISACVRVALRSEGAVVAVRGPLGRIDHGATKRQRQRNERRRTQINTALAALCQGLHIEYAWADTPLHITAPQEGMRVGDGLHASERGHEHMAAEITGLISTAWRASRELSPAVNPAD